MALKPGWGAIGPPLKETGKRVDLKPDLFANLIEAKGSRMAWRRASLCPCDSVNDQTDQADPNCPLCSGKGWYYFGPGDTLDFAKIGSLDLIQRQIVGADTTTPASVIRVLQTSISEQPDALDKQGRWISGDAQMTVRQENRLGYWDRLVDLDSTMAFSERLTYSGGATLPSRYPAVSVNQIRTLSKVMVEGEDFEVVQGVVTWKTGKAPASRSKLAMHYLHHPTWLVVDHPHAIRTTFRKLKVTSLETPQGNPISLPVQAHTRLEFLVL